GAAAREGEASPEAVRACTLLGMAPGGLAALLPPGGPGEVVLYVEYRVAQPTQENLARGWLHAAAVRQAQAGRAPHYLLKEVALERGIDARLFYDNWRRKSGEPLITYAGGVYV